MTIVNPTQEQVLTRLNVRIEHHGFIMLVLNDAKLAFYSKRRLLTKWHGKAKASAILSRLS